MRRLVRSYFRLRYFPRLLVQMVETASARQADGLRRVHEGQQRSETRLADMQAEVASMCDEAARSLLASSTVSDGVARRLEATQRELAQVAAEVARIGRQLADTLPLLRQGLDHAIERQEQADVRVRDLAEAGARGVSELGDAVRGAVSGMGESVRGHGQALHEATARRVDELAAAVRGQAGDLARMERFLAQQARLFPSNIWSPDMGDRVRASLALLAPSAVEGVAQVRVGRDLDGGYVMLDDFAGLRAALSLGISDDASWDEDVARHGIEVLQFDPSVPGPPVQNERFRFERLRIAPEDGPGSVSLASVVAGLGGEAEGDLLLKMDIEGAEWDVLAGSDEALLRRFRQIVLEFHDLDRLGEDAFGARAHGVFAKLARSHIVTHVHGNNCGNFAVVGNVPVPQSLEVSFALRSAYRASDAPASFPTGLDRPNQPGRADLFLGAFRFAPPAEPVIGN